MTDSRIWEIDGKKPLSPAHLIDDAIEFGWPTEWHGLANGIECPRGKHPGYGHFLVSNLVLQSIPKDSAFNVVCKHELGTTTFEDYYLVDSQAVTKQITPAHWITVADKRYIMRQSATGTKRYNLRKSKTEYVTETTNGGTAYTWQEILVDLWDLLPAAGACPDLQTPPASTPENLVFDGLNAWDCINQILTATGHIVVLDPIAGTTINPDYRPECDPDHPDYDPFATDCPAENPPTIPKPQFSFVDAGSTQANLAGQQSIYSNRVLWDYKPSKLPDNKRPGRVQVTFHILPTEENDAEPNFLAEPHVEEQIVPDTGNDMTYPVIDTMFYWDGRGSDTSARATEIANNINKLTQCYVAPWGKVYAGCLEFKPGSQVSSVIWLSDGDSGFCTHVRHTSTEMDWPRLYLEVSGGGGGVGFGDFVEDYDEPTPGEGDCPITQTPPRAALILVTEPPCNELDLAGEEIPVYDNLGCVFDHDEEDLEGVRVVFGKGTIPNPRFDDDPGTEEAPNACYDPRPFICVWVAIDRCCVAADSAGGSGSESGGSDFESF